MPDRVLYDKVQEAKKQLNRVIRGKEQVLQLLFAALFAEGHVLMEDVPGTGKTTLAKALALSVTADFSRIQFTPDLLPADILGSSIYSPKEGTFFFLFFPDKQNRFLALLTFTRLNIFFFLQIQIGIIRITIFFHHLRKLKHKQQNKHHHDQYKKSSFRNHIIHPLSPLNCSDNQ